MKLIDDIAAKLPNIKQKRKAPKRSPYSQKMQSFYGVRKFLLLTHYFGASDERVYISLLEFKSGEQLTIGNRNPKNSPVDIQKAIKSLERKAGCKLYYVLLISTDGEYL